MNEKLVIVSKKKTTGKKILDMVWFVLACLMFLLAIFVPVYFTLPAFIFAVVWYYQTFRSAVEYEYTYYDGDLRFAKIKAKRKRKNLARIQMDDVMNIAPKGDRSVYKYEGDKNVTCKNLTSGDPGAKVYELICKGEGSLTRYEFEPDEDMLNAIMIKYPRSVIK